MTSEIVIHQLHDALEKTGVAGRALERARSAAEDKGPHDLCIALEELREPIAGVLAALHELYREHAPQQRLSPPPNFNAKGPQRPQ